MARDCMDSADVSLPYRLVEAAVLAPTPDNNQPWRFVARDGRLDVFLDASRSLPSDVNSMFDLIGLGAAVENLCLAARHLGHEARVEWPVGRVDGESAAGGEAVATIRLQSGRATDAWFANTRSRHTSRSLYSRKPIGDASLAKLTESLAPSADSRVDWITHRRAISELAAIVARSDRLRFEYEPFHAELFRQLRFSADEVERTRDGLDVRTLGLPPGGALLLRMLGAWARMRLVHRLGLGWLLTVPSSLAVRCSGAIGVLSVSEPTRRQFLEGGRALQRIWLAADAEGLAMQPLGSLAIFLAHVEQLDGKRLPAGHVKRIERLAERFGRLVPTAAARTLLMVFRLGRASPPRIRSLRRSVEDVLRIEPREPLDAEKERQ